MKVYQKLGQLSKINKIKDVDAYQDRLQYFEKFVEEEFPSGSGFDNGTKLINFSSNRIVLEVGFHHMDEHGGYDGWSHHEVTITSDLEWGFNVKISGKDRNNIKEYISEVFHETLSSEIK